MVNSERGVEEGLGILGKLGIEVEEYKIRSFFKREGGV